ncbi:MAG: rhomboid family intramembrane serine protease [Bradymonadales bacterium]|nr:MAG: rhomboid family intramembrane serine protease [Bradymonadales bacterium]
MMFPPFRGFVRVFVISCTAVFVLLLFSQSPSAPQGIYRAFVEFFGLFPERVLQGMLFQPITWVFLHGNFMHLLFNMFAFWMFGSLLESTFGTRRFVWFNLFCALFTAGCIILFGLLVDDLTFRIPTIGASGLVFGILIAVARLYPNQVVLFFFIIPMKLKYFAYILMAIEFYALYASNQKGISNIAHLGGALFGFLFVSWWNNRFTRGGPMGWIQAWRQQWIQRRRRKQLRIVYPEDKRHYHREVLV